MKFFSYPKVETLWNRDLTTFKVRHGDLRWLEFALPKTWLVTEKVDGTNLRVMLDRDGRVTYGGRTDEVQMQTSLIQWCLEHLPADRLRAAFDPDTSAILFGEGYGEKIESGGGYRTGVAVRLFDVVVFGAEDAEAHGHPRAWWLNWPNIEDVAKKLGLDTVPVLDRVSSLEAAVKWISGNGTPAEPASLVAAQDGGRGHLMEGIVCRTDPLLFTRRGGRLIWKLKAKDV